ncbi:MAG: T9SS type A sorting domain-containing protein, partial [Bacteroidota bacterium]
PSNGNFNLLISGNIFGTVQIKFVNTLGQTMGEKSFEKTSGTQKYDLNVSHLSQGLYLLQLQGSKSEENYVTKLLIK